MINAKGRRRNGLKDNKTNTVQGHHARMEYINEHLHSVDNAFVNHVGGLQHPWLSDWLWVKAHLADNRTCTLCPNQFQNGQIQRLPAAVLDWRPLSRCSKQLSSALHHSVDSLLRSSNTLHSVDKATFAIHEISCTYYSYRLADHPQLSAEFTEYLNRLPQSLNTSQDRAKYRRLIDTYGTHCVHQVQLGVKVKRITAFRTCLATLKGYSESEINNCLNAEL
ncbi:unnamed protein product [Pleuronectes platessa]|uniref:MACPF domain-containing protein n=1 Tax=Pleuronectes platessa TaxID=8262 RepID=A0A9N7Z654_PLEPL|nr:unnamed protein product [Pleuronectes platessa]